MKVMLLGDVHGDVQFMESMIQTARGLDADMILQLGDFGYWTHTRKGVHFLNVIDESLDGMPLWFVDGNHECFENLYKLPIGSDGLRSVRANIKHIPRGHRFTLDGIRFIGFGGASSIDGPDGPDWWTTSRGTVPGSYFGYDDVVEIDLGHWWPEEVITQAQVDAVSNETVDVLLAHDSPSGVQIPSIDRTFAMGRWNRKLLAQVVEKTKPSLLVHGHYHSYYESQLDNTRIVGLGANLDTRHQHYMLLDTEDM